MLETPNATEPSRYKLLFSSAFLGFAAGSLNAVLGLAMLVAWYAHWSRLLQVFPAAAPMQFNTALCFLLCGVGLLLLQTRRAAPISLAAGGSTALLTGLTLLEYFTGRNLGIDELLFRPYFQVAAAFPGRMAPLTAFCFVLIGGALVFTASPQKRAWQPLAAGLLACMVVVIGTIALLGYLTHTVYAYGWGAYSGMAFNTAIGLITLAGGLSAVCWDNGPLERQRLLQWAPIAAAVTLLVMVGVISVATVDSLRSALRWRRHTYEVLLAAQAFSTDALSIQYQIRAVSPPDPRAVPLDEYSRSQSAANEKKQALVELTRDNPRQQLRLQELTSALAVVAQLGESRLRSPFAATPAGRPPGAHSADDDLAFDRLQTLVVAFIQEENRLLAIRSGAVDVDFHSAARLLGFGTALAAAFLFTGTLLVRRETRRRHLLELRLLAEENEVKTLSGLLPICAHCKRIRDDQGYWSQIESYIQDHSEATFSHGMCESCVRELYPAIADRVLTKLRSAAAGGNGSSHN